MQGVFLSRLVTSDRSTSSQILLSSVHWLPTQQRLTYKLATVVYKSVNCTAHSIFPDFSTKKKHLRADSNHRNNIFCLFRVYTLLLAAVISVFVVISS